MEMINWIQKMPKRTSTICFQGKRNLGITDLQYFKMTKCLHGNEFCEKSGEELSLHKEDPKLNPMNLGQRTLGRRFWRSLCETLEKSYSDMQTILDPVHLWAHSTLGSFICTVLIMPSEHRIMFFICVRGNPMVLLGWKDQPSGCCCCPVDIWMYLQSPHSTWRLLPCNDDTGAESTV